MSLNFNEIDINRKCITYHSNPIKTNLKNDIDNFSDKTLKNGIYTLDDNKTKFKISTEGYYCYQYNNPLDKKIYNIIFKFYKTDKEPSKIQQFKDFEFNINKYEANDDNNFIYKMVCDIIRTLYYNFEFILKYNIFDGKIPMLHNVINKLNNNEIPIFIQSNYQNAYVCTINTGIIMNIGYYKNDNELISIGAADVILHE